jgi:transcriptional regulator with XRE-family HTH domain
METDKQTCEFEKPAFSLLKAQRERLRMTQQRVTDIASINIRLYQRLESGERQLSRTSFRIGVALADILELDVHMLVHTSSVEEYLKNKE